jgi:hypothetical protein
MICSLNGTPLNIHPKWAVMADQIVITEKTSQANRNRFSLR